MLMEPFPKVLAVSNTAASHHDYRLCSTRAKGENCLNAAALEMRTSKTDGASQDASVSTSVSRWGSQSEATFSRKTTRKVRASSSIELLPATGAWSVLFALPSCGLASAIRVDQKWPLPDRWYVTDDVQRLQTRWYCTACTYILRRSLFEHRHRQDGGDGRFIKLMLLTPIKASGAASKCVCEMMSMRCSTNHVIRLLQRSRDPSIEKWATVPNSIPWPVAILQRWPVIHDCDSRSSSDSPAALAIFSAAAPRGDASIVSYHLIVPVAPRMLSPSTGHFAVVLCSGHV